MNKTGKILIGVLSVGALLGTGYASWHLNNGFAGTETGNVGVSVNDIVINSFAEVKVEETGSSLGIAFDGDHPDLNLSYNVKAVKKAGQTNDPYDLTLYEKVAKEYIPDLQISVKAYKKGSETLLTSEELNNVTKYITLPETETHLYTAWLSEDAKANGFDVTLDFGWSTLFDGLNPQEYYKNHDKKDAEATIKDMISVLKGVDFRVHFDVGEYTFHAPESSGEITISKVPGSTLSIEGMKEDGTIEAGEHTINIALDEGKQIQNNELTVVENGKDIKVPVEETRVRATGKVYTCTYNFKKDATYSFKYVVEEIPTPKGTLVEGTHENVTFTTLEGTNLTFAEYNVGETIKFKATASKYYKVNEVKVGEETLLAQDDVYTFIMKEGSFTLSATAIKESYALTVNANGSEVLDKEGKPLLSKYEHGTKVEFKVTFDSEKKTLESVKYNGRIIEATLDIYSITIEENNVIDVTLKDKEIVPPTPVVEKGNVSLRANENVLVSNLQEGEFDVGTEITFKATAKEGYELKEVKHNETLLSANESGDYTFKVVKGENVITTTAELIPPVEKVVTIKEAIGASLSTIPSHGDLTTEDYTVQGKIVGTDMDENIVIYDGTNNINCYLGRSAVYPAELTKGSFVKVTGKLNNYYGMIQFKEPQFTLIDTLDVSEEVPSTWTKEQFDSYYELATTNANKIVDESAINNVQYITLEGDRGATTIDLINDSTISTVDVNKTNNELLTNFKALKDGARVKATGYLIGANTSSKKYNFVMESFEEVVVKNKLNLVQTDTYLSASKDSDLIAGEEVILTVDQAKITEGMSLEVLFNGNTIQPEADGTYKVVIVNGENKVEANLVTPSLVEPTILNATSLNLGGSYNKIDSTVDVDGVTITYKFLMKGTGGSVQNKNKNGETTYLYNSTACKGIIDRIEIVPASNYTSETATFDVYFGTEIISSIDTLEATGTLTKTATVVNCSTSDATYFRIQRTGSGAAYLDSITIYYK